MSTPQFPIKTVDTNREKGLSFKHNLSRFKKAKSSGYYLECLWILYAMIEDRTSAFLFYIGFTGKTKRSSITGSKRIKIQIREILEMEKPMEKYKFDTLSGKLQRIGQLMEWSTNKNGGNLLDYQKSVRQAIQSVMSDDFSQALNYLTNEWRDKRNQLTHSLFIKDPATVVSELEPLVEKGYVAARVLDKAVNGIKKARIRDIYAIR